MITNESKVCPPYSYNNTIKTEHLVKSAVDEKAKKIDKTTLFLIQILSTNKYRDKCCKM